VEDISANSIVQRGQAKRVWFYYVRFLFCIQLWPLVGVLAVFAAVHSARLAWLAVTVFGISFLFASSGIEGNPILSYAQRSAMVWVSAGVRRAVIVALGRSDPGSVDRDTALPRRLATKVGPPFSSRHSDGRSDKSVLAANRNRDRQRGLPFDTPVTDWYAARERWLGGLRTRIS